MSVGMPVTVWKRIYLICINASLSPFVIYPGGCESTKRKTISHASSASVAATGSLRRYSGEGEIGGNGGGMVNLPETDSGRGKGEEERGYMPPPI